MLSLDLQFSSEDEFDEVPFATDGHSEHTEMETLELNEVREEGMVLADDDSQQAAEAMVQLGNVGFYMGEQQLLQQGRCKTFNSQQNLLFFKMIICVN